MGAQASAAQERVESAIVSYDMAGPPSEPHMITIHHLGVSQSDRIVWLMEELGLPYRLKWYDRGSTA